MPWYHVQRLAQKRTSAMASDADVALAQLRDWAGEAVFKRGQDYELRGRVRELSATAEGGLVAWVQGSERYATRVFLRADQLESDCTCPYGSICKHAVAVALAYLARSEQAQPLPVVPASDPRLVLLERQAAAATALATLTETRPLRRAPKQPASQPSQPSSLPSTQAELVCAAHRAGSTFPRGARRPCGAPDAGQRQRRPTQGRGAQADHRRHGGARLAQSLGCGWAIRQITARFLTASSSSSSVATPTQSCGSASSCWRLGSARWSRAMTRARRPLKSQRVLRSSSRRCPPRHLQPDEQLTWAIDALLRDPYDLCYGAQAVLESPYPPVAWSMVADDLLSRLAGRSAGSRRLLAGVSAGTGGRLRYPGTGSGGPR